VGFDIGYKEWTGYFLTCPLKLSSLSVHSSEDNALGKLLSLQETKQKRTPLVEPQ